MRFGKQATLPVVINKGTLPVLWTDFNTLPGDGLLRSSHVAGSFFVEQLNKGSWVRVVDGDENSCVARIKKIQGPLFYLEPDWSTWRAADELTVLTDTVPMTTPSLAAPVTSGALA